MIRSSVVAAFGFTAAAFALPAAAQMSANAYAGLSIGQSKFSDACTGSVPAGFSASCDDKDTAWRIFGGYQFHPNIAVEIGYADLGRAQATVSFGGLSGTAKVEATAFDAVAVGSWPLNQAFSVYGKLGLYHGEAKLTASGTGAGSSSDKDTGSDLTFGLGARYDFNRNIGVRAEWQRYNDFSGSDIDVLSLGVLYRFR
jgi:OOP family OmpA-OmpF porin